MRLGSLARMLPRPTRQTSESSRRQWCSRSLRRPPILATAAWCGKRTNTLLQTSLNVPLLRYSEVFKVLIVHACHPSSNLSRVSC
jgi:hypothetical protein